MRKRRFILVALFPFVAVFCAVGIKAAFFPAPGVTVQNFQRLHQWMTLEEVESILGHKGRYDFSKEGSWRPPVTWTGASCIITIYFGTEDDPIFHTHGLGCFDETSLERERAGSAASELQARWGDCLTDDCQKYDLAMQISLRDKLRWLFGF